MTDITYEGEIGYLAAVVDERIEGVRLVVHPGNSEQTVRETLLRNLLAMTPKSLEKTRAPLLEWADSHPVLRAQVRWYALNDGTTRGDVEALSEADISDPRRYEEGKDVGLRIQALLAIALLEKAV